MCIIIKICGKSFRNRLDSSFPRCYNPKVILFRKEKEYNYEKENHH